MFTDVYVCSYLYLSHLVFKINSSSVGATRGMPIGIHTVDLPVATLQKIPAN